MHGCISVGVAMDGESRPLICTKCGSEMVVLAIITNLEEVQKILNHLRKNKSPPFDNKTQLETS